MTHEEQAFLKAICDQPEDDGLRLIYADWLGENAGEVECSCTPFRIAKPTVEVELLYCKNCKNTGRVPDMRAKRAEFIRVQIEIAELCLVEEKAVPSKQIRLSRLISRESALMHVMHDEMRRYDVAGASPTKDCLIRRGFFESLTLPSSDFFQHADDVLARHPIQTVKLVGRPSLYLNFGYNKPTFQACLQDVFGTLCEIATDTELTENQIAEQCLSKRWPKIKFEILG